MNLIDICELIVDCPHSTANDEGNGYPLIRTPNVGKGYLILDGAHRVSKEVYDVRNARAIPQADDIILAREAPAGNVALIKEGQKVCLGQRTVLIRPDKQKVNPSFLTYYLLSPAKQHDFKSAANGATVEHINMPKIRGLKISLPPRPIQDSIATTLSRYDALIANYQRQIKLLEEAAQRLYKEWFVDLHFPGHENVKVVDGVPEGWEKKKLVDLVDVLYGYAFDGKLFNQKSQGKPIIRIRNIPTGRTEDYTTEDAPTKYVIHNGDILVGMDGEFHINSWSGSDAYLVQRACSFRPKDDMQKGFLFQAIVSPIKFFEKTLVGATVAHLGKKHIDSIEILFSNNPMMYSPFQRYFNLRQKLLNNISLLAESRDRLLPKLMSGEIEL
jgi:type I restriction enzyme, S subunit